jgi:precorrin-3B synthase
MQTGDGLLARLPPAWRALPIDTFTALCAAARAFGNGIVEVTARGSIQVRGLRAETLARFGDAVTACGIEDRKGPALIGNALAGRDRAEVVDVTPLLDRLQTVLDQIASVTPLAPKVSVVVDGGGVLHLDAIGADLRLCAERTPGGIVYRVAIDGDAATARLIGSIPPEAAIEAAAALTGLIASRGTNARARTIVAAEGIEVFTAAISGKLQPAPPSHPRRAATPIGVHTLKDGRAAVGIALPFGHAQAEALEQLAEVAARCGATDIVPVQDRALLAIGLDAAAAPAFAAAAEALEFVTRADDPRRFVIACAGAPACASGEMPARASALAISRASATLLDGSIRIHVSGCAKGCAHSKAAALTFVGDAGWCGLVVNDTARASPTASFPPETLPARIEHLAGRLATARHVDETSAELMKRLTDGWVSATILEGNGT